MFSAMAILLFLAILLLGVRSTYGNGQKVCSLQEKGVSDDNTIPGSASLLKKSGPKHFSLDVQEHDSLSRSIQKISNILELGGKAAIVGVDLQVAFADVNGSLYVSNGLEAVIGMNRLRASFSQLPYILTQDFHPPNHISFAVTHGKELFTLVQNMTAPGIDEAFDQMLWPVHAVENTEDAMFHPLLNTTGAIVVKKGTNPYVDSYSGFGDIFRGKYETTIFKKTLENLNINTLFICGLATDYCVLYTVLDAIRHGYTVYFIQDCSRGVNPETTNLAIKQMEEAGALII